MSKELPAPKPVQVISALERAGFLLKRQTGSHAILYKAEIHHPVTVPIHAKDLPIGTLRAIIRQANLTVYEFIANWSGSLSETDTSFLKNKALSATTGRRD